VVALLAPRVCGESVGLGVAERSLSAELLLQVHDSKFSLSFGRILASEGIQVIRNPVRVPRANGVAERFVGTVRRKRLERTLILGRHHLGRVLGEYVAHFNRRRTHRSIDQRAPCLAAEPLSPSRKVEAPMVRRTAIFDGLMRDYRLAPAPLLPVR